LTTRTNLEPQGELLWSYFVCVEEEKGQREPREVAPRWVTFPEVGLMYSWLSCDFQRKRRTREVLFKKVGLDAALKYLTDCGLLDCGLKRCSQ